jgi:hypothetical protein
MKSGWVKSMQRSVRLGERRRNIGQLRKNGGGPGVSASGTFTMSGCIITSNTASFGGGLYLDKGTLKGNPQIGGTTATASGGWIHGNTPNDV